MYKQIKRELKPCVLMPSRHRRTVICDNMFTEHTFSRSRHFISGRNVTYSYKIFQTGQIHNMITKYHKKSSFQFRGRRICFSLLSYCYYEYKRTCCVDSETNSISTKCGYLCKHIFCRRVVVTLLRSIMQSGTSNPTCLEHVTLNHDNVNFR